MSFYNAVAKVLADTPEDFAQAVFSCTARPQEAKYLFILMLLNGLLDEEMLLTEHGVNMVKAVTAHGEDESHQAALMRFMCEDAEFAHTHIEADASARLAAAGQESLSDISFWQEKTRECIGRFPDRDSLVRTAFHILYADMFTCSFNEAAERLAE
ncbi:MAG: hypothetical protein DELT_02873 [Desulfovibrio sp.]